MYSVSQGFIPHSFSGDKAVLKVAAYIRVSTEREEQESSFEAQKEHFLRLISENEGWVFAGIYSDYGVSATSDKNRTGFKRLLRHAAEGRIDRIVCKSVSRFARNVKDFLSALEALKTCGTSVYFEKENMDSLDPANGFVLTALGAIAQEESRSISENIRWGYEKRCLMGQAANVEIYGYRLKGCSGEVEVFEEEAEVVRRIFNEAAKGESLAKIAEKLNADGAAPPTGRANNNERNLWTGQKIRQILKLERYTGDVLLNKAYTPDFLTHKKTENKGERPKYLIKNHHPPIVSREVFVLANDRRKRGDFGRNSRLFSGLIVCGDCGRLYTVSKRRDGLYWRCGGAKEKNGCGAFKGFYEGELKEMFIKAFVMRFSLRSPPDLDFLSPFTVNYIIKTLEAVDKGDYLEGDRLLLERELDLNSERAAELERLIAYLEDYGAKLEKTAELRKRAVIWLRGEVLLRADGAEFFKELTETYLRAFALSITININKEEMTVCWADDSRTKLSFKNISKGKEI